MANTLIKDLTGNMTLPFASKPSPLSQWSLPEKPKGDPAVMAIQEQLNAKGANLVVDGIMGPKTRAAMSQFGGGTSTSGTTTEGGSAYIRAITGMLKAAQEGNTQIGKQYLGAAGQLRTSKQTAENRATDEGTRILTNEEYNPVESTSMYTGAEGAYQPSILSADKQLAQLADVYGIQSDIYKNVSDAAQKAIDQELDKERIKQSAVSSANAYTNYSAKEKAAQKAAQQKIAEAMATAARDTDGFVTPAAYRDMKAAWVADGFSGSTFDSIFGGYVNPKNQDQYGTQFITKSSSNEDDAWYEELINSVQ